MIACNLLLIPIFVRRRDFLTPLLAVVAAFLSYYYFVANIPIVQTEGSASLSITWSENVKFSGGKMKGFAKSSDGRTFYVIYSFANEQEKDRFKLINPGSFLFTMEGSFQKPTIPSHDYSFNMADYLQLYGASGIFESRKLIEIETKPGLKSRLSEHRWKVKEHIGKTFPPSLKVEAEALLIGDRSGMDEELAEDYRTLGITHLFAISGLHVGLLTFLLRSLLLRMKMRKETVDMLLVLLLPLYAVLAGGAPSVWRAVSVTVLVLLTSAGRIQVRLEDALSISATVFILYQPFVILQPGFQLSYLAAYSLVFSSYILVKARTAIAISFMVTAITQFALYPVLLFHFHELSLSSFFVNLFYVPLYSFIILPLNIILLILTNLVPPLSDLIFMLYVPLRNWISELTSWISDLPYQLWTPGKPDGLWAAIAAAGVVWAFIRFESGERLSRIAPMILIPALIIHFVPYLDQSLKVTFLDVGQGDSIIVEFPHKRKVYVIDTGGSVSFGEANWKTPEKPFEIGKKIVVPYLRGRGITTIDKLILTHADSDHIEGADEVIEELTIREIHLAPGSEKEKTMEDIIRLAKEKRIPLLLMKRGVSWKESSFSLDYVWPVDETYVGNDSSLVLHMSTEGPSFLFTGDMEQEGEAAFLKMYGESIFRPMILKAGHHGSRTSSTEEFISTLLPIMTIFSAGKDNRYGHPHPEVVDTFKKYQLKTLSTADEGSITVNVKRGDHSIRTMKK